MEQSDDAINSWLDELSDLIQKKKEENQILKKFGESLQNPIKSETEGNEEPDEGNEIINEDVKQ